MECYILAGGRSKRFGEDKLLYRIGGSRAIDYVLRTASQVCDNVFILAKDKDKFSDTGFPVVMDVLEEQAPIVGLLTALEHTNCDKVMLLCGDMPLIRREVLSLLKENYREPVTLFRVSGKLFPTVAIYSKELLDELREYINEGRRSLIGFVESVGFEALDDEVVKSADPELVSFLNMNTKEDLQAVLERLT